MQMKSNRATSVDDYKLLSSFEAVRKTLLSPNYTDRLEKPLAYWVLPNDRRLPLAFLPRPLQDLLETPFEDLSATPGVGQKKISSLVKLLHRATEEQTPSTPYGLQGISENAEQTRKKKDIIIRYMSLSLKVNHSRKKAVQ